MLAIHKFTREISDCERDPDGKWRVVRRRRVPAMTAETDDPQIMALMEELARKLNPASNVEIEVDYVVED